MCNQEGETVDKNREDSNELWSALWYGQRQPQHEVKRVATRVRQLFAAPRNQELVATFLSDLNLGCYYVYGAGSHTHQIWDTLRSHSDARLLGLIDSQADRFENFEGFPVVTPEQAAATDFDQILLSHSCREADMRSALTQVGVPEEKVQAIYSDPGYIALSRARCGSKIQFDALRCAIVRAGRSQLIPDRDLCSVFAPEESACFFIGRQDYREDSGIYRMVDLQQSLDDLTKHLLAARPEVIYLASGWFNNYLSLVISEILPEARFVHEILDWNLLFNDPALTEPFGHSEETAYWNLLGEYHSTQQADMVLSKRGGDFWQTLQQEFRAEYQFYFPGARPAEPASHPRGEQLRLVYGGILPQPGEPIFAFGYDFLPLFEQLTEDGAIHIDMYNSLHDGQAMDDLFASYLARYATGNLRYHPRLAYDRFLETLADYDYGWLAAINPRRDQPEKLCTFPKRAIGYLAAGLPIFIEQRWVRAAQLVARFEAGVVLSDFSAGTVRRALLSADRDRHRAGARKLAAFLVEHNNQVLARLSATQQPPGSA